MIQEQSLPIPPNRRFTAGQWVSLICLLLLFLILRWNIFTGPFERDEGEYAYSAWLMRHGTMPYENSFLQKPPMIIYTYMLGQLVSEDSELPPRILATISVALSTILVGFTVSRDYGKWVGISAMWIMTPMLTLPTLGPFAANTEVFMIMPLFCMLALYNWKRERANNLHWLGGGVCAALAFLYKPIVLLVLLFIFAVWSFEVWRSGRNIAVVMKNLALAMFGACTTTLLVLSPFLLYDSGRSIYECVGEYNVFYSAYMNIGTGPFVYFFKIFWSNWWIIFLLPVCIIINTPYRWWLYAGLFITALLTIYSTSLGHYYILVIPFWAILASMSINSLFFQLSGYFMKAGTIKKVSVIAAVIILLILPNLGQIAKTPSEVTELIYGKYNPFLESRIVAEHVENMTDPSDNVFIAGSEPQVLYYAKRKSSSRFIIMYPLTFNTPVALRYQEETIQALKDKPPKLIVLVRSVTSWLPQPGSSRLIMDFIDTLIKNGYKLVGGVQSESKQWDETVDTSQYQKYSMLVYKVISS